MSMTRAEIIEAYESAVFSSGLSAAAGNEEAAKDYELLKAGLDALRGPTREMVERVWRVCDACEIPCNNCESIYAWDRYGKPQECTGCPENGYKNYTPESQFCEFCGRPLTDKAVEMVMERVEEMKNG